MWLAKLFTFAFVASSSAVRLKLISAKFVVAAEMKNFLSSADSVLTTPPVAPVLVFDEMPVVAVPDVLTVSEDVVDSRLGQPNASAARMAIEKNLTSVCR